MLEALNIRETCLILKFFGFTFFTKKVKKEFFIKSTLNGEIAKFFGFTFFEKKVKKSFY